MVLAGHTAMVVGYGEVGRRVARGLAALDLRVNAIRAGARGTSGDGVALIHPPRRLPELLRRSRVVVLAVPLSPRTTGLIGANELALLPDPAVLVNVARGGAFSLPEVQRARLTELTRVLDDLSVHSGQ
jgi:phosphoglycerate dehydrogenase-like enzyme